MNLLSTIQEKIDILENYVNKNCAKQDNYSDLTYLINTIRSQIIEYNFNFNNIDDSLKQTIITTLNERFDIIEQLNDSEYYMIDELFEVLLDVPYYLSQINHSATA